MKSVLITGDKGFIGSNLAPLIDRYESWDIADNIFSRDFEAAVKRNDVVIHLAALTNVEDSKKNPKKFYETNLLGTAQVIEYCRKYDKKLIYPSTLHVAFPERSPYAHSKQVAELLVKCFMPFFPITILRLYNVYGANMNNNSGSIINLFLKKKPIEVWGKGEAKRDYINVVDVVNIMKEAISSKWNNKIVDIGSGKGTALKDVATLFSEYRNVPIVYKKAQEIEWPIANTKMLKSLYKKRLVTDLRKDIKDLCLN